MDKKCSIKDLCPFERADFQQSFAMTIKMVKSKFCKKGSPPCAREMVAKALGRDGVPKNLMPNQIDKATQLIEKHLANLSNPKSMDQNDAANF